MNVIEAMARAICTTQGVDPDELTAPDVLTDLRIGVAPYVVLKRVVIEDAVPAWKLFRPAAHAAFAAYHEALKRLPLLATEE